MNKRVYFILLAHLIVLPLAAQDAQLRDLFEERRKLDETVWKDEQRAQFFEQRIVRLWDRLRQASDKLAVLSQLNFEGLSWPGEAEGKEIAPGIRSYTFSGKRVQLSPEAFKARIDKWAELGFRIEQTEWHHQGFRFDDAAKTARSEVTFLLHVLKGKTDRYILEGVLDVEWRRLIKPGDQPEPGGIAIRDLKVRNGQGAPAFTKLAEFDAWTLGGPTWRIHPLMVYDLNNDGLSEVILGGVNKVLWNRGRGLFERGPFLKHWRGELGDSGVLADFTGDGFVDFLCQSITGIEGDGIQGLVDMDLHQTDGRLDELTRINADLDKLSSVLLSLCPADFAPPEVPRSVVARAFSGAQDSRYVIVANKDVKNAITFTWTGAAATDVLTGKEVATEIELAAGGGKVLAQR